jgi:hypothetical protein
MDLTLLRRLKSSHAFHAQITCVGVGAGKPKTAVKTNGRVIVISYTQTNRQVHGFGFCQQLLKQNRSHSLASIGGHQFDVYQENFRGGAIDHPSANVDVGDADNRVLGLWVADGIIGAAGLKLTADKPFALGRIPTGVSEFRCASRGVEAKQKRMVGRGRRTKSEVYMSFAAQRSFHGKCAVSMVLQPSRNIQASRRDEQSKQSINPFAALPGGDVSN